MTLLEQLNKLYHFTSLNAMKDIIVDNALRSDYEKTISLTRNRDLKFSSGKASFDIIRITIDRDKLQSHYKITPYSDNVISTINRGAGYAEAEERVMTQSIIPFINYIDRIDVLSTVFDFENDDSIAQLFLLCEINSIPYKIVPNFRR